MTPEVALHGRTMTKDMMEISGFGGLYEHRCRIMVLAGVHWLVQHPYARPLVSHYENIVGVDNDENAAAGQLTQAMLDAPIDDGRVGDGATGAMVSHAKAHALRAAAIGWEAYCAESRTEAMKGQK